MSVDEKENAFKKNRKVLLPKIMIWCKEKERYF